MGWIGPPRRMFVIPVLKHPLCFLYLGDVSFWRTTVTLTCPDKGDWYDNTIKMNEEESKEIKMDYDESKKNVYQCKYLYDQYDTEKTTYQFYFKGKGE